MAEQYWIRQNGSDVQGPFPVERVRGWVQAGRVRPEMEFSADGEIWATGDRWPGLFGAQGVRGQHARPVRGRGRTRTARSRPSRSRSGGNSAVWVAGTAIALLLIAVVVALSNREDRPADPASAGTDHVTPSPRRPAATPAEAPQPSPAGSPTRMAPEPRPTSPPVPQRPTKREIRNRITKAIGNPLGKGRSTEAEFKRIVGKPNRTSTMGESMYWYYTCSDGTVQVVISALFYRASPNGLLVVQSVNDY